MKKESKKVKSLKKELIMIHQKHHRRDKKRKSQKSVARWKSKVHKRDQSF